MRRRRDVADIERLYVGSVFEDVAELTGEEINLLGREIEASQPSDMLDIVPSDAFRHEEEGYAAGAPTLRPVMVPIVIAHPFLSPEWIEAVAGIRDEYRDRVGPTDVLIRANVTVTEAPFGETAIHGHIDTTGGALSLDQGHLDESDFAIELPYSLAREMFVERDPQAMLGALLGGQVKLTGDSSKVLGLAGMAAPPTEGSDHGDLAREVVRRIDEVTAKDDGSGKAG